MKIGILGGLVAAVGAVGLMASVSANANQDLATKSACMACHAVDKKIVGPAFKDIAKKYAADAGAEAKLAEKVRKGGSGVWGPVPMPPNVAVKDEDVKTLVKWIMSMK
jgi:cytochrome c